MTATQDPATERADFTLTASASSTVDHGVCRLPQPIAYNLAQLVDAPGDPRHLFFTVEALLRYCCVALKAVYLQDEGPPDPSMNRLIRTHLVQPSMGNWLHFLSGAAGRGLPFESAGGLLDFICGAQVSELIRLRNEVHGHSGAVLEEGVATAVLQEHMPTLLKLLRLAAPLESSMLVVCGEDGRWRSMMGARPAFEEVNTPTLGVQTNAAILALPSGDLPLFPLAVGSFEGFKPALHGMSPAPVLIFDGVDVGRRRLVYSGSFGRGYGRRWFSDYQKLVARKRVPMAPISVANIEPEALTERAHESLLELARARAATGLAHEHELRLDPQVMTQLHDAVASPARLVVVAGGEGVGKTTCLLGFLRQASARIHVPLVVEAGSQLREAGAFRRLLRQALEHRLGVVGDVAPLLELLRAQLAVGGRIVLCVDGVDEIGSVDRARRLLAEISDWLRRYEDPRLIVIISMRTVYWQEMGGPNGPMAHVLDVMYRPTVRSISGSDAITDQIEVTAAGIDEAKERYEAFRAGTVGYQPLTTFDELAPQTQQACRNPRWMTAAMRSFHGRSLGGTLSGLQLWLQRLDHFVYAAVGMTQNTPRFPARARVVDALLDVQYATGVRLVDLEQLRSHRRLAGLVKTEQYDDVLRELQSLAVITVEGRAEDMFSGVDVGFASAGLESAAHLRGPLGREGGKLGPKLSKMLLEHADTPLAESLENAATEWLAEALKAGNLEHCVTELPPHVTASAAIRAAETGGAVGAAALLLHMEEEARDAVLRMMVSIAWNSGCQSAIRNLVREIMAWGDVAQSSASIELVARVLRHSEAIEEAVTWLKSVARAGRHAVSAHFQLAEILRDKGQWRRATAVYGALIEDDRMPSAERGHALAARGECYVWLRDGERAMTDLDTALKFVNADRQPETACKIRIKRAIAHRLRNRPVRAVRELMEADRLAQANGFWTEAAKIQLELGLVACLLGAFDEALERVQHALERHTAQGFVKGQKKAWLCLGHVHQQAGHIEKARNAFERSLALNQEHFDLLGLRLNHARLAALLANLDPQRSEHHALRAKDFACRMGEKDATDESIL